MDTDTDLPVLPSVIPAPVDTDLPMAPAKVEVVDEIVSTVQVDVEEPSGRDYPSLYDNKFSTVVAILLGMAIVGGIQMIVWQIYKHAKSDYRALTQFVTMMVSLVLGAYMTDLLIAGPDTSLLSDDEHTIILGFVKDICLMVFSYYFGTRSASSSEK
jgi:hypothetical protein